jgi:hypothetical protein
MTPDKSKSRQGFARATALLVVLAAVVASLTIGASTVAASNAPLQIDFVKHLVDPATLTFQGTVSGAVSGTLSSHVVSLNRIDGPIDNITFEWDISAGDQSFTALTSGTWNTDTGQVTLNGTVISGYLDGAQVHEQGHLIDPNTLTFAGVIQLMPATDG